MIDEQTYKCGIPGIYGNEGVISRIRIELTFKRRWSCRAI